MKRIRVFTLACALVALICFGPVAGAQSRQHDPNKAEDLTLPLFPQGFADPNLTVAAGKYLINVLNRSGVHGINLEVDRLATASINSAVQQNQANGPEDSARGRYITPVTLAPGTYRVRVTNRPGWVCLITVK
jgi:hypothetical protein